MPLGSDEITIKIGALPIRLRASLRAAMRLERRQGGFGPLVARLGDGSLSTAAEIISECSISPLDVEEVLDVLEHVVLGKTLPLITPALVDLVFALAGLYPDAPETADASAAEAITYGEHHVRLYRIATGWLGWSPAEAWDASPAEILEAYRGRIDLLKAIFGGGDEPEKAKSNLSLDDKVKLAMQSFGTKVVRRAKN
jgi:hypothetical protein